MQSVLDAYLKKAFINSLSNQKLYSMEEYDEPFYSEQEPYLRSDFKDSQINALWLHWQQSSIVTMLVVNQFIDSKAS